MARNYTCPQCGTGRRAPNRMARDDVRRYCLPCSEATGKLVPMACPARDRAREDKRKRAAEQAKARREADRRARYFLADGTDVRPVLKKLRALRTWQREGPTVARKVKGWIDSHKTYVVSALPPTGEGDVFAVTVLRECVSAAMGAFPRHMRTERNRLSLLRAAGIEYFGLDDAVFDAVQATTRKLLHPASREAYTVLTALIQCARANSQKTTETEP